MTWKWGYIVFLIASVALASPPNEGSLKRGEPPQKCDSPVGQAEPSFFGKLTRSLTPRRLTRSMSAVLSPGEASSHTLNLDTIELAQYDGYDAERHSVLTEDGHILEVHRIYRSGIGQADPAAKPVVIVQHGFIMDSKAFLLLGQGKALGYMLADAGYDVWLSNFRGNTYCRKHTTLSPDMAAFWDFSYTEHGTYDLPAVFNYALEVTGRRTAHYIGHSMGSLSFLVMASKRPEMLSKVKSYTALAPISTTTNARSGLVQMMMKSYQTIAGGFDQAGVYELLSKNQKFAGIPVSNDSWYSKIARTALIFSLSGENPYFDHSILPDILGHVPSGTSVKTFRHFGQNHHNGFREYDYGAEENLARYSTEEPPLFDFSNTNVPSQIYFGINDLVADFKGAIQICKNIPNVFRCEAVDDPNFSHGDFLWATNAPALVYAKVIDGLRYFGDDDQEQ